MSEKNLLSIPIHFSSRQEIFQKIDENLKKEKKFLHIVSLNPEIAILAQNNTDFKEVVSNAEIQICDGTGVYFACQLLGIFCKERVNGVDLMENILHNFHDRSLCIVLIGGKNDLAINLAECYKNKYPKSRFYGLEGYKDIKNPTSGEENTLNELISSLKPDIVFVAFGSPQQELWIGRHRALLGSSVCMGVGGGFDFLGKKVPRAPRFIRAMGMEWLFRLILQPWRIVRQVRLLEFVFAVTRQKVGI
ncbi:WecB/TagA/CpsF family glycosyltransferase [Candidatus Woesebacteria bacterium]|nr:WecB/TagA/CpsF family glycosyltransferase [Candidatus Woesebacteria bacterium]